MGFGPAALRALSRRASPRPCAWTASIASGRIRVAGRAKAGQRLSLASHRLRPMAPWPSQPPPAPSIASGPCPRSRVERRPVSGFPCPGKAASQPAPALASLEQAPQRLAPWLHGPQPRPSHRQSPSAPPIDPPPGLVLSPQSPHKSGATSHRKVFVTRHISIDDGPHSPPAYPAPHAFGTIARSDGSVQMSSSRDKCPCVRCGIGCVRCGRGSVYRKQAGFCVLECTLLYNID